MAATPPAAPAPAAPMFEPGDIFASFAGSPSPPATTAPAVKGADGGADDDELEAMMEAEAAADARARDDAGNGVMDDDDDVEMAQAEEIAREADRQAAVAEEKRQRAAAAARRRAAIMAAMSQPTQSPAHEASQVAESSGSAMLDETLPSDSREFVPEFDFGIEPEASIFDEAGRPLVPVRAATASGSSVTFPRRLRPRAPVDLAHAGQKDSFQLLTTPLHHLKAEADEIRSLEKVRELARGDAAATDGAERPRPKLGLWVDKYRPKKFSDLLGEDRVHRDVMAWLKEWDRCVFKRIPPKKRKFDDEGKTYHDALGRPRERILLLSGPPGYGKTTLAHVVAKHAGYRTLEINASDDRNAATVSTRIQNAIDAGTGLGAEGRPTCVVIDEIDGASGGGDASFVRSLIKLIQDVPARKRTNTPAKPLRRPIICICNDLYATSLRPLRPYARIVRFRKPPSQFLVARLRDICDRERLTADLRVLTTLVDLTGSDVRSCLNTLQFIKSRSTTVTSDAIKTSSVGLKDSGTSLQTVWNALFIPMAAKQRRKQLGIDDGRYVDRLAFMVQACGEYDRVVQGCFEHYPNLKPLDASFGNICRLHDWVAYFDRLSGRIGETMEFELMAYLPYAVVPWHSHFAAPANATRPTEWPKQDYEAYQTRIGNEEIVRTLTMALPPALRSMFTSATTLTELIPLLMRVISPPMKPVNANIVKPAERAVLARLVELLIPLGLRFWQEQSEDGQPQMRLEPAIDVFVHYEGKRASDLAAARFAVRQLVAQAVDAEIARRRGQADDSTATSTAAVYTEQYGNAKTGKQDKADAPAAAPTDFFGRVRAPAPPPAAAAAPNGASDGINGGDASAINLPERTRAKFRAVYRFNEGSSSAVRKNVKMSALM